ncbi:hypothetical protein LEMLEM_LOCUS19678 [Lemmus lemmus]
MQGVPCQVYSVCASEAA